ncbi:MAG: hypothetical protein ACTSRN_07230 [Alphaproteobacteria bacterium]
MVVATIQENLCCAYVKSISVNASFELGSHHFCQLSADIDICPAVDKVPLGKNSVGNDIPSIGNLVFIVGMKQVLPYVRLVGDSWLFTLPEQLPRRQNIESWFKALPVYLVR